MTKDIEIIKKIEDEIASPLKENVSLEPHSNPGYKFNSIGNCPYMD